MFKLPSKETLDSSKQTDIPWHLIVIFLILSFAIALTGYFFYQNQKKHIKEEKQNELSAIADLKIKQITNWRDERMKDASFIFNNEKIADQIKNLEKTPASPELRRKTLSWMTAMLKNLQYKSMRIITSEGKVLVSVPEVKMTIPPYVKAHLGEAIRSRKILFSDLYKDEDSNIYMHIIIPILVPQKQDPLSVGALILRIDPYKFLYPLIQSWPIPSSTAETLLIEQQENDVVYLNELRHRKNTALKLRLPLTRKDLLAAMAVSGKTGVVEGIDYRGKPVLAAVQPVPGSTWFMVAKVDIEEVLSPYYVRFRLITILVSFLILSAGLLIGLFWRHQQAQFYEKQYELELKQNELLQKYEYLTRYANDIILLLDHDGKILDANQRVVSTYGYTLDELTRLNISDLRTSESRTTLDEQMRRIEEKNGFIFKTMHYRKDGTAFPVEVSARVIKLDGGRLYQHIIRDITERKQTEEAIQKSEEKYRQIFNNMSSGVAVYEAVSDGEDFIFKDFNRAGEMIENIKKEELIGKSVLELFPGVKEFGLFEVFQRVWKTAKPEHYPATFYKDQRIAGWRDNYIYKLPTGEVVAIYDDITERKKAEEALRESKLQLEMEIRASNTGLWDWDLKTNKVYFSPEWKRQIGYEDWEISDDFSEWQSRVHPDDLERMLKAVNDYIKNPWPNYEAEFRFRHKDGSYQWILTKASLDYDENGNPVRMLGSHLDITERKRIEDILKKEQQDLQLIIDSSPVIVFYKDKEGKFMRVNKTFAEALKMPEEDFLGKTVFDLYSAEIAQGMTNDDQGVLKSGRPKLNIAEQYESASGIRWVQTDKIPICDNNGIPVGLIGFAQDITERMKAEEELSEYREHLEDLVKDRTAELEQANVKLKELDRLKSMFIASMSHELRTPLNSVIGFSSILLNEWVGPLNPEQKENLSAILRSGKHLLALINDVIDVSKIEAGAIDSYKENFDLNDAITEAVNLFPKEIKDKGLELKVDSIYQGIYADRRRLLQCVVNLISNAVKFTERGSIKIEVKKIRSSEVEKILTSQPLNLSTSYRNFVEISVADTGIGIKEEDIPKLFTQFVRIDSPLRTKVLGTGLGLYLTKKLVTEVLKGEINVKSKYGEGSTFTIKIPTQI